MRSAEFNDIYFSEEDGLAETRHTFLGGCDLPAAWDGRARFCIAETGFGTGLNMLAAWQMFEETAGPGQRLDLVSVEKHPLAADAIRTALAKWDFGPKLARMLDVYPMRARGFHRVNLSDRVTLTLIFDDALVAFMQLDACVDAWFLDGFAPAKNPDMWTPDLYAQMARLSAPGARVATFTAAGDVRRGLAAAGFTVEKRRGYGRKRDMTVGRFDGVGRAQEHSATHVDVIGAGIAGMSAAWHLKRAGVNVTVYDETGVASGASGNATGLINPKLTAQPSAQGDYYTSAFSYARHMLRDVPGSGFECVGALHLEMDADRTRRFDGYQSNLGWHGDHMQRLNAAQASDAAGVALATPALFYPDAGYASPRDLCAALARDVDVRVERKTSFENVTILAAGAGAKALCDLSIETVRGQTTRLAPHEASASLKTNLCYGGYVTPVTAGGYHMCGATFQPWDSDPAVRADDHARNIAQLVAGVPSLAGVQAQDGWTGFRAASRDRFPIVGPLESGLYASFAHGSHGMISGLMAGAMLAAQLAGGPMPVGQHAVSALNVLRFKA